MSDHDLRLGDCLDPLTGLASLADKSVDHVICDPPYDAEAHTLGRRIKSAGGGGRNYSSLADCVLDFAPITATERLIAADGFARVVRRWVIVFCQVESVWAWKHALEEAGLIYKRTCAWIKSDAQPQLSGDRPGMGYESIVCAHAEGRSRWNGGGKRGVYESARASSIEHRQSLHMTEKPLPLIAQLIADFTDPGELICDPFAGSGTTGVACKRLGRRFIGWEKDATFWERAVRRLENTRQQYELLPRGPKPKQQKMVLP